MNILKAEEETIRLGVKENDKATDYSKFVFYGIHTMTFVGRINNGADSFSAREPEMTVIEVRHGDSERRSLQTENGSSKTLRDRIKIELIVEDSETEKTVNVILRQAQPESDEQGGQITVLEVTEIQRVATALGG